MVLEIFGALNVLINNFLGNHVVFISHMFAAVFLVLTETTMNMRIVTPMLDGLENMTIGNIPLVSSLITAAMFIIWATFSIYVYQFAFQWLFDRYDNHLTLLIIGIFLLFTVVINIKYRD